MQIEMEIRASMEEARRKPATPRSFRRRLSRRGSSAVDTRFSFGGPEDTSSLQRGGSAPKPPLWKVRRKKSQCTMSDTTTNSGEHPIPRVGSEDFGGDASASCKEPLDPRVSRETVPRFYPLCMGIVGVSDRESVCDLCVGVCIVFYCVVLCDVVCNVLAPMRAYVIMISSRDLAVIKKGASHMFFLAGRFS